MISIQNFRNEWTGKRIDFDKIYFFQCVDLILQYLYEVFQITGVRGNAIDYWTSPSAPIFAKFDKISTTDIHEGDIVVLNGLPGNPFGHIMIATGQENAQAFEGLEQNGQTGDGDGGDPADLNAADTNTLAAEGKLNDGNQIRTRWVSKSRIAGVLRPRDAQPVGYVIKHPLPGFMTAADAAAHQNSNSTVPAGTYSIYNQYNGMVNITAQPGVPGWWMNPSDNTDAAPAPSPAAPAPAPQPVDERVFVTVQRGWGLMAVAQTAGFADAALPSRWQAITDLNGGGPWQTFNAHLQPGQRVVVKIGGHGAEVATDAGAIPVSEVVPAPAPEVPNEPAIVYTRFKDDNGQPAPMQLQAKEGAARVNFITSAVVENLSAGTSFTAVGKATLPNNDTYFMNDNDFGIADETQRTQLPIGIKTSDLEPAPSTPTATPSQELQIHDSTTEPVLPATPELPWQMTFKPFMNPMVYIIKEDMAVYNFTTGNDLLEVKAGTPVEIGGKFQYNGHFYYRATSSIKKNTWYGFPVTALVKQDARNTPFATGDDIDQIGEEAVQLSKTKHAAIKGAASAQGFLSRFPKLSIAKK